MACGGTGGGTSESVEEEALWDCRGRSSTIRETVLGGLATGAAAAEEEEEEEVEEEEEEDEAEDGVGLLLVSVVRNLGGSRACFGGGGSC